MLAAAFPAESYQPGTARWELLPHALAVAEHAIHGEVELLDSTQLLHRAANLLRGVGERAAARPLLERALAIHERALGPDHPEIAYSLSTLALVLQDQAELAAAGPLFERALAIRESALGPDHPDTASSFNNLGRLLHDQGELAAARPLLERALAIRERVLGPDHPDTATSLNNLALLLQAQGELATARPLLERALAVDERAPGPDNLRTASVRANFKGLLKRLGAVVLSPGGGPAGPVVVELHPGSGPAAAGREVLIFGSGFTGATEVVFGRSRALSFRVDSDGQITAVPQLPINLDRWSSASKQSRELVLEDPTPTRASPRARYSGQGAGTAPVESMT